MSFCLYYESHTSHRMWHTIFIFFSTIVLFWFVVEFGKSFIFSHSSSVTLNLYKEDFAVGSKIGKNVLTDNNYYYKTKNIKAKKKIHVPKFMLDLYKENKNNFQRNYTVPDIVRSVIPKDGGPIPLVEEAVENHMLLFDIPTSNINEELLNAELKILTIIRSQKSSLILGVERIVKVMVVDDLTKTIQPPHSHHLFHLENTWISFNITAAVKNLLKNEKLQQKTLKIILNVCSVFSIYQKNCENEFELSLMPQVRGNLEHEYPVLLLSYAFRKENDKIVRLRHSRHKRNVEESNDETLSRIWELHHGKKSFLKKLKRFKNSCRRKPLFVNFTSIGYDSWIVEPSGYEAYQCMGKCFYPMAEHLSPTKHAIIQALVHNKAPLNVLRPCCTPTSLSSISLLYIDEKGILTYRFAYSDMVVDKCGCQ